MEDPYLRLGNNECIRTSTADGTILYLGANLSPWKGLQYSNIRSNLENTLQRHRSASLKQHQKLKLLITDITPPPIHSYHNPLRCPISTNRGLDSLSRVHVKEILHLPASTPNGILYCSKRGRELGVSKLETISVTATLKTRLHSTKYVGPIGG